MTTSDYPSPDPYRGPPPAVATQQERNWAMAAHAGSFLALTVGLTPLAPLLVLLAKGGESPYVRRHATESLNFQVNAVVYVVVLLVLSVVLVGIPLLIAYSIFWLICVVLGAVRGSGGQEFRYPLTIRLIT